MEPLVIVSCHSTWIFDVEQRRFRRLLRGILDGDGPATHWRPYYGLELHDDSETFVVLLNAEGTRRLRSWRHIGDRCAACDQQHTDELHLEDIAQRSN